MGELPPDISHLLRKTSGVCLSLCLNRVGLLIVVVGLPRNFNPVTSEFKGVKSSMHNIELLPPELLYLCRSKL